MYGMAYRRPYPNELYHYGIKGQKWGIRRYQNSDGSLTAAGKKRYLAMRETPAENARYKNNFSTSATIRKPVATFKDGTKSYTKYNDGSVIGYDSTTDNYFNVSKEYFEAISGITDDKPSTSSDYRHSLENTSEEYRNELMYNSQKNVYPEQTVKEFSKNNRGRKRAIERFVDKVKDMAKKVVDVAKSAFDAAKDLVSGLFSKKKSSGESSSSSSDRSSGVHTFTLENGRTVYKGRQ